MFEGEKTMFKYVKLNGFKWQCSYVTYVKLPDGTNPETPMGIEYDRGTGCYNLTKTQHVEIKQQSLGKGISSNQCCLA
jgi:hypothetical protein